MNPFSSFLLFLDFLLVICFCSFVNFGIYIVQNLFDRTVVYKLRNMKISEKHLEEMKQLVDYKEGIDEDDDDEEEEQAKKKKKEKEEEVLEIIDDNNEFRKDNRDISSIKNVEEHNLNISNMPNNNNKVVVRRKKNRNYYYQNDNDNKINQNIADQEYDYEEDKEVRIKIRQPIINGPNTTTTNKINQNIADQFNKNQIGRREIKNAQIQDSINFMKIDKKAREEQDMNKSKLKYVESKKQV